MPWRYTTSPGACDDCKQHEGKVYHAEGDIPDIPAHPNCQCIAVHFVHGEPVEMSLTVKENRIFGTLAIPTVSRNKNFYLPSELARQHGKRIPVYLDHEDLETRYNEDGTRIPTGRWLPMKPRGEVVLNWKEALQQLEFDGDLWDKDAVRKVKDEGYDKVSLAGDPQRVDPFHGLRVPLGLNFFSMAIVRDPGIPQTSLNMAAESMGSGPVVAESVTEMAAQRFVLMEGNLQMSGPQQYSNAPPMSRPSVSNIEPLLAKQNSQTMQTGVGIPAGTGVGPGVGVNQDPHLGGTGAPGVTGTGNITPMQGLLNQPKAYPSPQGQQICPHNYPLTTECPECNQQGMAHEDDKDNQQNAMLPGLLGYYIVQKLVHGGAPSAMMGGGMEAFGSASPGAASGVAPAGYPQQQQPNQDDSVQQHFASCPTCQTVHNLLFGGKKATEAELTSAKRDDLSDSKFAYMSDDGIGKLPINDAAHVRNALARFNQTDMPASAKAGALAKIHAAAKRFGVDVSEEYRRQLLGQIDHEIALREVEIAMDAAKQSHRFTAPHEIFG